MSRRVEGAFRSPTTTTTCPWWRISRASPWRTRISSGSTTVLDKLRNLNSNSRWLFLQSSFKIHLLSLHCVSRSRCVCDRQRWAYAVSVRTSAMMRTYESFSEVWTKKCFGYVVADLPNWTASLPQIRARYEFFSFWQFLCSCGKELRMSTGRPGFTSQARRFNFWRNGN